MRDYKSILITGGSSGIGRGLVLAYSASGVIISFSGRDEARISEVEELAREKGASVNGRIVDVTDAEAMRSWIEEVDEECPLDLVIANAGIATPMDVSIDERMRRVFDVNVQGVFNTVHPALERMRKRGRGKIAIMS